LDVKTSNNRKKKEKIYEEIERELGKGSGRDRREDRWKENDLRIFRLEDKYLYHTFNYGIMRTKRPFFLKKNQLR